MFSNIYVFLIVLVVLIFTIRRRRAHVKESMSMAGISCPQPGKNGYIDCNSIEIEDPKLRISTCEALQNHCKVIVDSEKPSMDFTNPKYTIRNIS